MSGPKLGPSPTYLGFTRDRTPKLRKSAIADLRWLASLAPQGDGLKEEATKQMRGKALPRSVQPLLTRWPAPPVVLRNSMTASAVASARSSGAAWPAP
jgi:hypothetical protein